MASTPDASAPPTGVALGDIPAARLALYTASAARFGIDWALLAAVGKVECNHGRSRLPGCAPEGSVNAAGATGPMQFLGPTWRAGVELGRVPPPGAPTTSDGEGYATDGDGDGVANIWGAADAIAAAARMLAANGAAADERDALLAYNHSAAYADEVLTIAAHYRTLAAHERARRRGSGGLGTAVARHRLCLRRKSRRRPARPSVAPATDVRA